MTLKKNKAGQFIIPAPKKKSDKVWATFQLPRETRNELTKIADKLGLNLSKYFRKKAIDLIEAAKHGKLPSDAALDVKLICEHCKTKIDAL